MSKAVVMSKAVEPKFVIEDDDEESDPTLESDHLVVADRAIGTLGFCGALIAVCACWTCCGCCAREIRESYNEHTVCGLCWPWKRFEEESVE